jgi:hypothetical protein
MSELEEKEAQLKKISQPVRALTNANGMITNYLKIVEQLMKQRGENADRSKTA